MSDITEETKRHSTCSLPAHLSDEDLHSDGAGLLAKYDHLRRRHGSNNNVRSSIARYAALAWLWILSLVLAMKFAQVPCNKGDFASGFDTDLDPLKAALEVQRVKFTGSLDFDENGTLFRTIEPGAPQYVGKPNAEIDANWEALLEVDGVDLKGDEAASVLGKTFQKPGGWSLVGIDGFHQIHCVNMMYKALYPEYYPKKDPPQVYEVHMNHCIDYLRQAVMCNVDISPMRIEWTTKWNRLVDHFDIWHTCRNFDKVKGWMAERNGLKHPLPKIGEPWSEPLPGPGVRDY